MGEFRQGDVVDVVDVVDVGDVVEAVDVGDVGDVGEVGEVVALGLLLSEGVDAVAQGEKRSVDGRTFLESQARVLIKKYWLMCSNKTHSLTRVNLWSESYKLFVSLSCSILWSLRFISHQADFSVVFFHILIGIVKRSTNPVTKSELSEAATKYVSLTWVFAARSLPARSIM